MPRQERNQFWCFTLFYPEDLKTEHEYIRYMVYQTEICPTSGREHLQGYVELNRREGIRWMKRNIAERGHFAKRMGTRQEAREYCMKERTRKEGTTYTEIGRWQDGGQGARTDLHRVCEMVQEGKTMAEVAEAQPATYVRMNRGLNALRSVVMARRSRQFRNVNVIVLYGEAGTGKTRKAVELGGEDYYLLGNDAERVWWDGYDYEKTLILDDFYGWINHAFLLRLLDGYQCRLPIKGAHVYAMWSTVIITSNQHPREWYRNMYNQRNISWEQDGALRRRITRIYRITEESIPHLTLNTQRVEAPAPEPEEDVIDFPANQLEAFSVEDLLDTEAIED